MSLFTIFVAPLSKKYIPIYKNCQINCQYINQSDAVIATVTLTTSVKSKHRVLTDQTSKLSKKRSL